MQAVVLAAGKGARLRPRTHTTPKPLIELKGTSLLERVLHALPNEIDEVFLVVNHLREQIIRHIGSEWNGKPIHYAVQEPLSGTAGALYLLKEHLADRFLVLNADDLYSQSDLECLIQHDRSILVHPSDRELQAAAQIDQNGRFTGLGPGRTHVCGAYVLDRHVFDYEPVEIDVGPYKEYGLPQTLVHMVQNQDIQAVQADFWMPVGTEKQLQTAKTLLK